MNIYQKGYKIIIIKYSSVFIMTTKVNKVSVEKAVANSKANSLIALDVLKSVKEKNQGLFKTSLGTKTEIYKKELFEGANEKQIKSLRKKFRNVTFNFLSTIANNADKKLIEGFIDFYKQVYVLNDFSFSSIASENTKEEKKEILIKGLEIVKKSMK
nr:MAG: hypothetical protein [Bacteriophage sp.]